MVASPALTPPGSPPTVQVAMNEGASGLSKTRDPTLAAADINPCDNVRSRRGAWRHSLLPPPSASGPQRLPSAAFCLSPWSPRYVVCKCAVACTPASAVVDIRPKQMQAWAMGEGSGLAANGSTVGDACCWKLRNPGPGPCGEWDLAWKRGGGSMMCTCAAVSISESAFVETSYSPAGLGCVSCVCFARRKGQSCLA